MISTYFLYKKRISLLLVSALLNSCCAIKFNSGNLLGRIPTRQLACKCSEIEIDDDFTVDLSRVKRENYPILHKDTRIYSCPVLINENTNVGLYQYWIMATHNPKDLFFIYYDSTNIEILENKFYEKTVFKSLTKLGFEDKNIEKALKKMEKIHNQDFPSDVF